MSQISCVICSGILALCLIAPVTGSSWWEDWQSWTGNWTSSPDPIENCPHNYTELNLCSRLLEFEYPCYHFVCCPGGGGSKDDVTSSSEEDEIHDSTGGMCPESICIEQRQCAYYICMTECCNGHHRNMDGTCHNKSKEIDCKNGGTLMTTADGFTFCSCSPGFMGEDCGKPYCGGCDGHGKCMIKDGRPVCECEYGYEGRNCEIRKCNRPCYNGGKCISDGRREMCNCTLPYVGKSCETKHEDSDHCPHVAHHSPYEECHLYCNKDTDCYGDMYCCKQGCSLVCKRPKESTCTLRGKTYAAGESFTMNNGCAQCRCTEDGSTACRNTTHCPEMMCKQGAKPVWKPDQCCQVCEEDGSSGEINLKCPEYPITLYLERGQRNVSLCTKNTGVRAYSHNWQALRVRFDPPFLEHCECPYSKFTRMDAAAYTEDSNGARAKCRITAYVQDRIPPVFLSCPEDKYIMEGDRASWTEPRFMDNVGITEKYYAPKIKGERMRLGNHSIQYKVFDFDRNVAVCNFTIYVLSHDTPVASLPEGLRERHQQDDFNVAAVVGPIIGAIGLFALIIAVCLFMRMRRRGMNDGPPAARPARQMYDNNIYHLPTDVKLTPPPYTLPYNPPAYSAGSDMKEAEYATIAPPTYSESVRSAAKSVDNPSYVTLGEKSEV